MSKRELASLEGKGIEVGNEVRTAYRGGVRQGKVKEITEEPKVVFTRRREGQPDKEVRHNPSTLEKVVPGDEEGSEELAKASSAARRGGRGGAKGGGAKAAPQKAAPPKARGGVSKQAAAGKAAGKTAAGKAAGKAVPGKESAPASPKTPTKPPLKPRAPAAAPAAGKGTGKVRGGKGGKRKAAAPKVGTRGSGRLASKAKASRRG